MIDIFAHVITHLFGYYIIPFFLLIFTFIFILIIGFFKR